MQMTAVYVSAEIKKQGGVKNLQDQLKIFIRNNSALFDIVLN